MTADPDIVAYLLALDLSPRERVAIKKILGHVLTEDPRTHHHEALQIVPVKSIADMGRASMKGQPPHDQRSTTATATSAGTYQRGAVGR
jgi:hypothetical protein